MIEFALLVTLAMTAASLSGMYGSWPTQRKNDRDAAAGCIGWYLGLAFLAICTIIGYLVIVASNGESIPAQYVAMIPFLLFAMWWSTTIRAELKSAPGEAGQLPWTPKEGGTKKKDTAKSVGEVLGIA